MEKTLADDKQTSVMNISLTELSQRDYQSSSKIKIGLLTPERAEEELFMKVKEDIAKDQASLAKMTLAIDELVKYLNDLADLNTNENYLKRMAIDTQFKEIKHVITVGEFNLDSLGDEDSLRAKIAQKQEAMLEGTDTKQYGPSTYILMLQSDFKDLTAYWEEQMDQQKQIVDQHEITANQLRLQA